jgi:alpha-ketoglutarate-dependent taurine dioxygenase
VPAAARPLLPPARSMIVTPLPGLEFGAEVLGIDLRTSAGLSAIRDAWDEHHLLLFRGQLDLQPHDEARIARLFPHDERLNPAQLAPWVPPDNKVESNASLRKFSGALPGAPEIEIKGIGDLAGHQGLHGRLAEDNPEAEWHTDGTDRSEMLGPPLCTQMYCPVDPPTSGGETMFASAHKAWDLLPPKLQQKARLLRMRMTEERLKMLPSGRRARPTASRPRAGYDVTHPLCRIHPHTGRPALCVAPLYTFCLVEMDASGLREIRELSPAASHQLIGELLEPGLSRELILTVNWRKGDLVVWDNR